MTPSLNNNKQQVVEDDRERPVTFSTSTFSQYLFISLTLFCVEINDNHAIFSSFGSGSINFLHRDF